MSVSLEDLRRVPFPGSIVLEPVTLADVRSLLEQLGAEERWICREGNEPFECTDEQDRAERAVLHDEHLDCGDVLVVRLDTLETPDG